MGGEKYYKVLRADGFSPTKEFDYSPYLPKGDSPGAWLPPAENAKSPKDAYYVSKYWNFWYEKGFRIYEAQTDGAEDVSGARGVQKQLRCARIRLLRDATEDLLRGTAPDGNFNAGAGNPGTRNIGCRNAGDFNRGSRNTGNLNAGDFNTGDSNEGTDNVGDFNKGSSNSGDFNTGHRNTGSHNTGSFNTGSFNTGNANTGSFNRGDRNCGKWNVGDFHTGHFNTVPAPAMMFNKPCPVPPGEVKIPLWLNGPDPKKAFEDAGAEDLRRTLALPNFDFAVFEEITGISEADFRRRLERAP